MTNEEDSSEVQPAVQKDRKCRDGPAAAKPPADRRSASETFGNCLASTYIGGAE
jgi:hypothetical protein